MHLFNPTKPRMFQEPVSGKLEILKDKTLWVNYAGTSWSAELHHASSQVIPVSGQLVRVVGIQGNTLLIAL